DHNIQRFAQPILVHLTYDVTMHRVGTAGAGRQETADGMYEFVNQAGTDVKRRHHEQHDLRIQINQADQHRGSEQSTTGTGFVDIKFLEAVIPYGTDHQKGHKSYYERPQEG